jgi:hypothetical protein
MDQVWFEFTYIELEQVCQTLAEACPVWCIHECGDGGGCSGGSCTYGNRMPYCWKYAVGVGCCVVTERCKAISRQSNANIFRILSKL